MTLVKMTPILTTDNMERSVRFYVELLGFTCTLQTPSYSNLLRDGVRIILSAPQRHEEWLGSRLTGQLYIHVDSRDEVDALWAAIKDHAKVTYPVQEMDYGAYEFGICDDNGYGLAFGAPSKTATV